MIGQSLSNTNEMCYSVQIAKIYNLNKALLRLLHPAAAARTSMDGGAWAALAVPVHAVHQSLQLSLAIDD